MKVIVADLVPAVLAGLLVAVVTRHWPRLDPTAPHLRAGHGP